MGKQADSEVTRVTACVRCLHALSLNGLRVARVPMPKPQPGYVMPPLPSGKYQVEPMTGGETCRWCGYVR